MLNALGFDAGKEDGIFGAADRRTRCGSSSATSRPRSTASSASTRSTRSSGMRPPLDAPEPRRRPRGRGRARTGARRSSGSVVAIDPGHGLDDPGLVADGVAESDVTWRSPTSSPTSSAAGAAGRSCCAPGTRRPESTERVRRANAGDAALCISIRLGAGEQARARVGVCFHYGTPTTPLPDGAPARRVDPARARATASVCPMAALRPRSIAILRETRMPAVQRRAGRRRATRRRPRRICEPAFARRRRPRDRGGHRARSSRAGRDRRGRRLRPTPRPRPRPRPTGGPRRARGPRGPARAPAQRERPCRRVGPRRERAAPSAGIVVGLPEGGLGALQPDARGPGGRHLAAVARDRADAASGSGSRACSRPTTTCSVVHATEPGSNDAWTLLGALAARTERLRLGTMVSPVTFRLAGGAREGRDHRRPDLRRSGASSAWARAGGTRSTGPTGSRSPRPAERFEMLEEQLEIVHGLWSEDVFSFESRHYALEDVPLRPEARSSARTRRSSWAARAARGSRDSSPGGRTSSTASAAPRTRWPRPSARVREAVDAAGRDQAERSPRPS